MAATSQPYDQRDGVIWMNGELIPWRDARVHLLTHALHYGSAVFEGERVYDREIFKLTEHSQRLHESAKGLDFGIPYSVAEIDKACRDVVRANGLIDGYVRPIAWRGSEQMGVAAQATKINLAVAAWDWGSYFDPAARTKGLRLTIAQHRAERAGYADALMLDWRGQIAESTGANIFFVQNGVLHTPLPDCFLDGITRRTVIGLAKKRGLKVIERAILPEEMAGFSECFITGTAAEVTPVSEIGPYRFTIGDITRNLMDDYSALVHQAKAGTAKIAAVG